ncbi:hypothetical protein PRIPAC_92024, partial [Pristionchus pacificus]
ELTIDVSLLPLTLTVDAEKWKSEHRADTISDVAVIGEYPCCKVRPSLRPFDPRDGILVFGVEKKKIQVNKKSLASQSPFFDRLFYSDFKEKNMTEIPIAGVEYEEFLNMLSIIYGFDNASLTNMNACVYLHLADRFEIKIFFINLKKS